jgi:uncharacterized protein
MPGYDWDEAKRLDNLEKHGYDFRDVRRIYEHPSVITQELKHPGEKRYKDLAEWSGKVLALIYTMREGKIRVISLRPAHRKERREYYGRKHP